MADQEEIFDLSAAEADGHLRLEGRTAAQEWSRAEAAELRADASELRALAAEDRLTEVMTRIQTAELRLAEAEEQAEVALDRASAAEDRLRARALLLSEFEHKLKTSFSIISGWSSSLADNWERFSEEQRREGLQSIRRRADEVVEQATALLQETHAEIATLELDPTDIDLTETLRLSCETFAGAIRLHHVRYEGDVGVHAYCDPGALQQILGQLLENAVKYSPDGGDIVLGAHHGDGDTVVITIRDPGIGIPEHIDIFEPFVRAAEHKRAIPGSGIGLYIVANLVGAMSGRVHATRNAGGIGSTFTVELPAS